MAKPTPERFQVDVKFTGLFAVVPEKVKKGKPKKLALVVPQADFEPRKDPKKSELDGGQLFRHRWFIDFDPSQLTSPPLPTVTECRAIWTLSQPSRDFRRVTFDVGTASGALDVGTALDYVSDLNEVTPDLAKMPKKSLGWKPNKRVAGQVMIDRGRLIPPSTFERQLWIFPPTVALETLEPKPLHHEIHLRFSNVEKFDIVSKRSTKDPGEILSLRGQVNKPVEVVVCCLCDQNPLRWEDPRGPETDDDFRWYYQLFSKSSREDLTTFLQGLDLPVPHVSSTPNGQGHNCLSTQFKPRKFKTA